MTSSSRDRRLTIGLALAAGLVLFTARAEADVAGGQGAQLAAPCASCHGPNGGPEGIPVIAGQDAERIIRALLAYRNSERPNHIMYAIARSLSEEEIAVVARYLAALRAAP